jgi:hypothetical protein
MVVRHDVPMSSNFFVTCAGLLLFPVIHFLRKSHRERKRWSDSEYSPYDSE